MERQYVPLEPPRLAVKHWRILGVLALLVFPVRGDVGRPLLFTVPPGVLSGPVVSPVLPNLYAQFWYRFWYNDNGRLRREMSGPAGPRVQAAFDDAASRARAKGFKFRMPELRQSKSEIELFMPLQISYILAITYQGGDLILVNHWWVERLTDAELRILAGHELGHVIDRSNQRHGHAFFETLPEDGESDRIADAIAGYLYSPVEVLALDLRISTTSH